MNRKAWKKLSPELQQSVRKATEVHAKEQLEMGKKWEKEALDEMLSKGLKWSPEPSEADKQAWKKAAASLYDEYAAQDKYSKQLVDILKTNNL